MQSKIRPAKKKYVRGEWYPWFAWWPTKVYLAPDLVPKTHIAPWHWVWLKTIEYKEPTPEQYCRLMDADMSYILHERWYSTTRKIYRNIPIEENGQKEEGAEIPSQGGE